MKLTRFAERFNAPLPGYDSIAPLIFGKDNTKCQKNKHFYGYFVGY